MKTIEANGRRYRLGQEPVVVVCVDGCEYDYLTEAAKAGVAPFIAKGARLGLGVQGRLRRALVHQPQQPLHRHRHAASGARHLRQLLL
jgi:hypothetical protein